MTVEKMEAVEIFAAGEKGRGLRATRELKAGEVVFAEASYAAVVFDSLSMQVCHSCFRRQANLHRCAQCRFAHYCDRTCQRAAWEEHKQECAAIKNLGNVPKENIRLAARALWHMRKYGGKVSDSQLTTLDMLEDHVSEISPEDLKSLQADVQTFQAYWPRNTRRFGDSYVSHILGVIICNAFTLSDQRGLQAVGVGIFPNLCLVNHDCWPNCTVILNHGNKTALDSTLHSQRRIELRSLGTIAEGEELTVSYVDFLNLSKERQRLLKQQYYFDCKCEHCSTGIKDDLMMAVQDEDGKKPSPEQVKEVTELSLQTLEKIEKARTMGDYHEVMKLCYECLEKQEPVLADTHLYHLRVLSAASEVLSYQLSFKEAAGYARRMVEGYMKLYHPNNAQLGMAIMRAGVTNWHAGLIELGHGMICKAYAILMVTHGPHHPITKDLEAMRTQTEVELRMFRENECVYQSMREAALQGKPMAEPIEEQAESLSKSRK
ncbi:histone-lysine N-methyltransferase SMYD1a [Denticeps clupeoides]|uniref:[histone H3]-lysine(4) N-trimethyltransferase n=1 Tax=Denticeps clupeoides TaxID=299321 RepID=A0AAY4B149_9TELE|nr:histone-lysine N-methyltransferase Smyd1-like [Denticeps clupeoides]